MFFSETKEGYALYTRCGACKRCSVPIKPSPSTQATIQCHILNSGKARSYEPKALNETMLPLRRKKS